jgi:hypothetical protein
MPKYVFDNGKNLFESYDKDEIDSKIGRAMLEGTLPAGDSVVGFVDESITTDSMFDFYTSIYGINPTSVVVGDGELTLRFEPIGVDLDVRVRVL